MLINARMPTSFTVGKEVGNNRHLTKSAHVYAETGSAKLKPAVGSIEASGRAVLNDRR